MTLLIKNVKLLGAAREYPEAVDVFVNEDKISAIGSFPNKTADVVLSGHGAYLSPGFIDVNSSSDHYLTLFDHPGQEDSLRQGVTTIVGGMCGSSLAPLLYGSLESFQKWGDTNRVNVGWHTMAEFLKTFDMRPLGVNFATLVGHGTVRRAMIGESLRELTKNELGVLSHTVEAAIREGGFGMSTGLGYVHERSTPYGELKSLAALVRNMKGVYATHLRNTGPNVNESIAETIALAKETGVTTLVNHFVPVLGAEKDYEAGLAAMEALPANINLRFDIYPYEWSLFPLYTFLPEWAQTGGVDVILANIQDEWLLPKIIKDMKPIEEDDFVIARATKNDFLVGKSLRQIKEMYDAKDARAALIRLMVTMKMRGGVLYKNLNKKLIDRAVLSKRSLIASNAPSFKVMDSGKQIKSERTTSTFLKFISLAEDEKRFSLEDAVKKLSRDPAEMFGLAGRGEIKEGNIADLACFKDGEVRFTVVNGRVAFKNGAFQDTFAGKALRHSPPK